LTEPSAAVDRVKADMVLRGNGGCKGVRSARETATKVIADADDVPGHFLFGAEEASKLAKRAGAILPEEKQEEAGRKVS
jgi:hypothetical protein